MLVSAGHAELKRAGLQDTTIKALRHCDAGLLEFDTEWLANPTHHLLTWDSEQYPALLRDIPSPPAALFVDGDPDTLWQPQIAVIGSRNPTAGGRDNALDFAAELSRQGLTVTSGMASGIDSIAHGAALDAGGYTVAVTGTGLDIVYSLSFPGHLAFVLEEILLGKDDPPATAITPGIFLSSSLNTAV